ncbi:ArsR/SmtB family transcription factor [Palaeococcus sp. (in: euryarchaeotes)]|nr:MAG: transcriptional regulator [Thermococci archaeon]
MTEPDIFYIIGNKVRRDLLSHLTCTECYFSLLSNKVSVSSTAVSKHLKIMEREGVIKSYEKDEHFIGPARKYYRITLSKTYIASVTPNLFWYSGVELKDTLEEMKEYSVDLRDLKKSHENLQEMVSDFIKANRKLKDVIDALRDVESYRNHLVKRIKETYLTEIGDMTQLAILHYLLLYGESSVDDLSDVLDLKEREVLRKAEELSRFVPLIIKDNFIKIDEAELKKKLQE